MSGTTEGGKKAARKIGKEQLAKAGSKGGRAKVPKGAAMWTPEKRAAAGSKGGKERARRYQDPNFDREAYAKRRFGKVKKNAEKPRVVVSHLEPDEYLRRTNINEYNRQRGIVDEEPKATDK